VLGIVAVLQVLVLLWSVLGRWDDELAYALRATRDSYELREAWRRIGRGDVANEELEYQFLSRQQSVVDSHDIEKGITNSEKQLGMRAGLIEFQQCVCGQRPTRHSVPWRKTTRCAICGGN
jgi:mobilome CxxCx(11)CxxC protein